jgi:hypothetical protein
LDSTAAFEEIEAAVVNFLRFIDSPPNDPQSRLRTLALALDRLALAYHSIGDIEPGSAFVRPEKRDWAANHRRLASLFPEFGLYTSIEPAASRKVAFDGIITGDAVDDLEDIVGDLSEVAALISRDETQNAVWNFKFSFETHWGRHLRDLQGYVHHLMHER